MAFTGHRSADSKGRSTKELEATRSIISAQLERSGASTLYSSVAEGADTIACEEALKLGLALKLFLPLPISDFKNDFADRLKAWPVSEKLIQLAQKDPKHSLTILNGERPDCYAAVNKHLLSGADALLAVTTDSPQKTGGASEMLGLAQNRNIPCTVINPLTQQVTKI